MPLKSMENRRNAWIRSLEFDPKSAYTIFNKLSFYNLVEALIMLS